ncbi:MAG TPA: polyprenyl synthetase family protein [Desulfobacterales bacterium]|nr:polyprenyl synthetase family protein [Desulfobacterales bacterium]
MELKQYLIEKKRVIDQALERYLPECGGPAGDLIKAMRYSLFAGGKRLRPILCIASAEAVGGSQDSALPAACALEFIHTYSLIHDDLPVMDDDELRRGVPTNHIIFGEAVALLAGDGLLTEAFRLMCSSESLKSVSAESIVKVVELVAEAAGYKGMVGGQVADIQAERKKADKNLVDFIHTHKTAALITASVVCGGIIGGGTERQVKALRAYGKGIGLAFQISDDLLDVEGDAEAMGKPTGSDERKGKATYPSLLGIPRSKEIQDKLVNEAVEALNIFDDKADPLREIAYYIVRRKK